MLKLSTSRLCFAPQNATTNFPVDPARFFLSIFLSFFFFHGGTMASGWFGSKAIELIRARSLFVNVSPAPTSLSERRAVLHALKRYGPIEVFKRLPVS
jgi:hypothetical protein